MHEKKSSYASRDPRETSIVVNSQRACVQISRPVNQSISRDWMRVRKRYLTCTNMFIIVTFYAKFVNERSIVLLRLCSFYCMPVRSNDNSFSLEWISFCCLCWPSNCFCCYGFTRVAAIEATFFSAQVGMWEQKGVSRNNDREFKLQRRLR